MHALARLLHWAVGLVLALGCDDLIHLDHERLAVDVPQRRDVARLDRSVRMGSETAVEGMRPVVAAGPVLHLLDDSSRLLTRSSVRRGTILG